MYSLILPYSNHEAMSVFLEEVSAQHPDDFILMVVDKAGWHTTTELRISEKIRLIFRPPHSHELSPVKHLWAEIREKWFKNLVFKALDHVETLLVHAVPELEQDHQRVQSITGFNWIKNLNLTAY